MPLKARQPQIEDQHVRADDAADIERVAPVGRLVHLEPGVAQHVHTDGPLRRGILGHQHPRRGVGHAQAIGGDGRDLSRRRTRETVAERRADVYRSVPAFMTSLPTPERLRPGRHHIPRADVARSQRERMLVAVLQCVAERRLRRDHGRRRGRTRGGLAQHLLRPVRRQGGVLHRRLRLRDATRAGAHGRHHGGSSLQPRPGASACAAI